MQFNLQLQNWGFITSKKIIYDTIHKVDRLQCFSEKINNINKSWNYVSMLLVKTALSGRRSDLRLFYKVISETIELETSIYKKLSHLLEI